MKPRIHIHEWSIDEASWAFRSSEPTFQPYLDRPDGSRQYLHGVEPLDPFPAYAHDLLTVRRMVRQVQRCFRPAWDVHLYVLDREEVGRTNAYSTIDFDYYAPGWQERKGPAPRTGRIVLAGKRIPPDPKLTEYLVAHEYGHNVEWMLEAARDPESTQKGAVVREYAELRGLESDHHGTGGTWHNSPTEVFACDFRILVCGVRPDFWPHHGVDRPEKVKGLRQWWDNELARPAWKAAA